MAHDTHIVSGKNACITSICNFLLLNSTTQQIKKAKQVDKKKNNKKRKTNLMLKKICEIKILTVNKKDIQFKQYPGAN